MPKNFMTVRMHVEDEGPDALDRLGSRPVAMRGARAPAETPASERDEESAARHFLSRAMGLDDRPAVRGLSAPERPEVVPALRLLDITKAPRRSAAPRRRGVRGVPAADEPDAEPTTIVRFEQTRDNIRIFGSRATVELDSNRELLSINAMVADVGDVSPVAALSAADALRVIARTADVPLDRLRRVGAPELMYYMDEENEAWHLAWVFRKVPAAPKELLEGYPDHHGQRGPHGLGRSPRDLRPLVNYLIDAHTGDLLLYYSATPMVTLCRGEDEDGAQQRFYANQNGNTFEMFDALRSVRTFDLAGADIDSTLPASPVTSTASEPWQGPAAISAHVSATKVQQFLQNVLGRNGIDDKGMELVSIVNCTYGDDEPPPEWHNAVWYDNRMWYGQAKDNSGRLRSFARYLDVIAHELMHGVTEYTADLMYRNQSGALNESMSDIFGIIISNWYRNGPESDVSTWNWELGSGLGDNGGPLRDMSDPRRTGDPDHMDDYLHTHSDSGGVHTNSNIHNKAAYNVLTAKDPDSGEPAMMPSDVAVLYYLALRRLSNMATFADVRAGLIQSAKTYFGNPQERKKNIAHIEAAYDAAGIT